MEPNLPAPIADSSIADDARRELAKRELARRHLLPFILRFERDYIVEPAHHIICAALERFMAGVQKQTSPRLIIEVQPRIGKSTIISRYFPAFGLGHNPAWEFVITGYALDLPVEHSRFTRSLIQNPLYTSIFPHVTMSPDTQGAEFWRVGAGGSYKAVGVGGGLTGSGAHVLVVDDPTKDSEQADSKVRRDAIHGWFSSVAYTRLAPGGGCCLLATRWNDDDLLGRVQREASEREKSLRIEIDEAETEEDRRAGQEEYDALDKWEVVSLESILEKGEQEWTDGEGRVQVSYEADEEPPDGWTRLRRKGDSISTIRFPTRRLRTIRQTIQPRHWSALYQQSPVPDSGLFFVLDDFRFYSNVVPWQRWPILIAWDLAVSEKQSADFTVATIGTINPQGDLLVLDMVRGRFSTVETARLILDLHVRYSSQFTSPVTGIEQGVISQAIDPFLQQEMSRRRIYPSFDDTLKPLTDKQIRARPLQGLMQAGRVHFPVQQPWVDTVKSEMLRFPSGLHDDIVDSLAWLARMSLHVSPPPENAGKSRSRLKSWRDQLRNVPNHDDIGAMIA